MDSTTLANRTAWDNAYQSQLRAYDEMLAEAATGATLVASERELLRDILAARPVVVHPQSGNGQDDIALVQARAHAVIGVDYSETAVRAAQGRADDLGVACRYLIATVPGVPLHDGCADLVYTGRALFPGAGRIGCPTGVARASSPCERAWRIPRCAELIPLAAGTSVRCLGSVPPRARI